MASDDIFEEVDKELRKPEPIQSQETYPIELLKAMVNKNSYIFYKEVYLSGYFSSELKEFAGRNSIGFVLFGTFSGPRGQIGDTNIQFRATYYDNRSASGVEMDHERPEMPNDFEIEFHNAYFRLRVLPPVFNVRIGHLYVPYGIQPWIDTHGTLLQGPAMRFIGLDTDWGIAFDGQNDKLEYQAGLMRGSGMRYLSRDRNFALAGKLSTPRIGDHIDDWLGISFIVGRIFDPMGAERLRAWGTNEEEDKFRGYTIRKWRIGIDAQKIIGPLRTRFELSGGHDNGKEDALGGFTEIKYSLGKSSRLLTYFQLENLTFFGRGNDTLARLGFTYSFSANYNFQFVVSEDINTITNGKDTQLKILFYGQKGGGLLDW